MTDLQKIAILAFSDIPNRKDVVAQFEIALNNPHTELNMQGGKPGGVEPTPRSIINSIKWGSTPQGYRFWSEIYLDL